jgi:hypothetical protein
VWLLEIASGSRVEKFSAFPSLLRLSLPLANLPHGCFNDCYFPELSFLKIEQVCWQSRISNAEDIISLTSNMPRLETLIIDTMFAKSSKTRNLFPSQLNVRIAPIKEIRLAECIHPLISYYFATLKVLEINNPVNELNMEELLKHLISLKSLSVYSAWRNNSWQIKEFTINTSIKFLQLKHLPVFSYGHEMLRDLVLALLSIKTLLLPS